MAFHILIIIVGSLLTLLFARTLLLLRSILRQRKTTPLDEAANNLHPPIIRKDAMKTLVVLGSGGHTTEMLHLLKNLDPKKYKPLLYVVAATDSTSLRRVDAFVENGQGGRRPDQVYFIPRSREVGQSYFTSIFTTLWSFLHAFGLVLRIRPNLLLCNGPGTCLPIAICTFLYRILGLCEGKIVFVESFCRVTRYELIFNHV